jgi:hypothetical protein
MIVGSVQHVVVANGLLEQDGGINLAKAGSVACSGLDTYYEAGKLAQYPYAKVDALPWKLLS